MILLVVGFISVAPPQPSDARAVGPASTFILSPGDLTWVYRCLQTHRCTDNLASRRNAVSGEVEAVSAETTGRGAPLLPRSALWTQRAQAR